MHPLDQQTIRIVTLHAARTEEERDRAVAECQRLATELAEVKGRLAKYEPNDGGDGDSGAAI